MPRENALAEFIKYQLRPLAARDEIGRHFRIFNWEAVRPTAIYRKLISLEATPGLNTRMNLDSSLYAEGRSPHADDGCHLASRSVHRFRAQS